jgi:hypothetical protein
MNDIKEIRIDFDGRLVHIKTDKTHYTRELSDMQTLVDSVEKALARGSAIVDASTVVTEHEETPEGIQIPPTISEWYYNLPNNLGDKYLTLLIGYYLQSRYPEDAFDAGQVKRALKGLGAEPSNVSISLNHLSREKMLAVSGKHGRLNAYRVTADGVEYIKQLLGYQHHQF